MKLSARLIAWHLEHNYEVQCLGELSCQPILKYATIYDPSFSGDEQVLYVTDCPDFQGPERRLSQICLLVVGDAVDSYAEQQENTLLIRDATCRDLLDYLIQLYEVYDDWNQSLVDSRLRNEPIQTLLDLTDVIIPNPIYLVGMDFTILASKGTLDPHLTDSMRANSDANVKLISVMKQDPNYQAAFYRKGYFFYPGNDEVPPCLCCNVQRSGKTIYRLIITPGGVPIDDTFGFLLEYLVKMITHAMSTSIIASEQMGHPLHQIFSKVLCEESPDNVKISQLLTSRGWLQSHQYQCIWIQSGLPEEIEAGLLTICNYVENAIPGSSAVKHRGGVAVFVNLDLCPLAVCEIPSHLSKFLRESLLSAGFSRCMEGHFYFRKQYVQAVEAQRLGKKKKPSVWITHFNDISMEFIFSKVTESIPGYMVCHEKLLMLRSHDKDSGVQLYSTLRTFLENNQNTTQTARALYIHRSTLLYRLERIQEILNCDFHDSEQVLYLLMSYRLLDEEENLADV